MQEPLAIRDPPQAAPPRLEACSNKTISKLLAVRVDLGLQQLHGAGHGGRVSRVADHGLAVAYAEAQLLAADLCNKRIDA